MSISLVSGLRHMAATAFVFAALAAGAANASETPDSIPGVTVVNAEKAKSLLESGAAVIDTRVANEYAESHIKGAKSVPYKEKSVKAVNFDASQDSFDVAKLPAEKGTPIVFYCNAGECWKSYKASVVAKGAGYTKIHWFRGGMPEWKSKGYPVE